MAELQVAKDTWNDSVTVKIGTDDLAAAQRTIAPKVNADENPDQFFNFLKEQELPFVHFTNFYYFRLYKLGENCDASSLFLWYIQSLSCPQQFSHEELYKHPYMYTDISTVGIDMHNFDTNPSFGASDSVSRALTAVFLARYADRNALYAAEIISFCSGDHNAKNVDLVAKTYAYIRHCFEGRID